MSNSLKLTSLIDAGDHIGVAKLIQRGIDVNDVDIDGSTPLIRAACQNHLQIVQELLRSGADVNALEKYRGVRGTAIILTAQMGLHQIVDELLKYPGIDVSAVQGYHPLLEAIRCGHWHVVQALLYHRVDVNIQGRRGMTPLMEAAYRGDVHVVQELVMHNAQVNWVNNYGLTALMIAALSGQTGVVLELLKHPAIDVTITNEGLNALKLAKHPVYHSDIVNALMNYCVTRNIPLEVGVNSCCI